VTANGRHPAVRSRGPGSSTVTAGKRSFTKHESKIMQANSAPVPPAGALDRWRALLGPEQVETTQETLAAWGRRTFGPDIPVAAILRPASAAQVSEILAVATEAGVPLHPVSRGANWGLGSRAPTVPGAAILDLSRLDRITDYDATLGTVRVEPGVTFKALADFLKARNSDFYIPEIGGSPDASVLANALDRGDGAMGDRWASLSDFAVALPDGREIRTGFSGIGADALAGLHPTPAGPILDGLFSQSNLGVVTGATVSLERMPTDLAIYTAEVRGLEALGALLEIWRLCQREGALRPRSATLWNGIKFLARKNPRSGHDPGEVVAARTGHWLFCGFLCAESPAVLSHRSAWVAEQFRLGGIEAKVAPVRTEGTWHPDCEGLLGEPAPQNLRTAYWMEEEIPAFEEMDPDLDGCGLLWLCLALPFDEAVVQDFARDAERLLEARQIDLNIGIEAPSPRCLLSYISLAYDRSGPAADENAIAAYRDLLAMAEGRGLAPYRLANGAAHAVNRPASALTRYIEEVRRIGDPAGILSPGRSGIG